MNSRRGLLFSDLRSFQVHSREWANLFSAPSFLSKDMIILLALFLPDIIINSSDIKVIVRKLLPVDMDKKFLDHNAINSFCGEKSGMELEQSGQNICAAVKGEIYVP